jgi:ketosteroid isomerase-like protein
MNFHLSEGDRMSELETRRQGLLVRLFEAFNRHDGAAVMDCMTEDVVFETAGGPELFGRRITGSAEVRAAFEQVWTTMPDVSWTCTGHSVFGDRGLSEWIFRATAGDGRRIEAEGCDLFAFRGEKLAHKRAFRKERPLLPALTVHATV